MRPSLQRAACTAAVVLLAAGCAGLPAGSAMIGEPAGDDTDAFVAGRGARQGGDASGAGRAAPGGQWGRTARAAESRALFRRGRDELMAGRPRDATEHFAALLDRDPFHVGAINAMAVAVAQMGRLPEAVSLFRRAVALAPDAADLQVNLGYALHRAGEPAQAREALHRALALQPRHLQALYNLALLEAPATSSRAALGEPIGPIAPVVVAAAPAAAPSTAKAAAAQAPGTGAAAVVAERLPDPAVLRVLGIGHDIVQADAREPTRAGKPEAVPARQRTVRVGVRAAAKTLARRASILRALGFERRDPRPVRAAAGRADDRPVMVRDSPRTFAPLRQVGFDVAPQRIKGRPAGRGAPPRAADACHRPVPCT